MDPQTDNDIGTGPAHRADTRNPDWKAYVPNGHGRTDEQIRADVHEAACGSGSRPCAVSFMVSHGIVTLMGEVASDGERKRIIELVRAVPSVADIHDELHLSASAQMIRPGQISG